MHSHDLGSALWGDTIAVRSIGARGFFLEQNRNLPTKNFAMKNFKKIGLGILAPALSLLAAPFAAMAQTYEYHSQIATTTQVVKDVGGDILLTVVVVIGIVAGIFVLIVGVKWGFKKLRKAMNGSF